MFSLDYAGPNSFDVRVQDRAYAGLICSQPRGDFKVYWDSNAARGSTRRFATVQDAVAFIHSRRVKKGWRV
jgi:hypothetical protein